MKGVICCSNGGGVAYCRCDSDSGAVVMVAVRGSRSIVVVCESGIQTVGGCSDEKRWKWGQ